MTNEEKHVALLLLMEASGLIDVPSEIGTRTKQFLRKNGLLNKEKLAKALQNQMWSLPGFSPKGTAQACWYLIYGNEEKTCEHCWSVVPPNA
jgi:hypothetical protein